MTHSQSRALAQLADLADRLTPRARSLYLAALADLVASGNASAAVDAIARGDTEGAVRAILPDVAVAGFAHALISALASIMADSGPIAAKEAASALGLKFTFVPGSPAAAAALERLDLTVVAPLIRDTEAGLRDVLTKGLLAGLSPRQMIKDIRPFVGLTPADTAMLASFERQLRTDPIAALGRELRDKRFDASLVKAANGEALTEAQIATMRARYAAKLVTFRAETWARTSTLMASRAAQHATWLQAAEDLGLRGRMMKTWVTTLDGRERPTHHALHGNTVPLDQPFANGDMIPGDGTGIEGVEYNCRCVETIRVAA